MPGFLKVINNSDMASLGQFSNITFMIVVKALLNLLQAFVDDPNDPPEIWAHHTLESQIDVMTFKSGIMYLRAARQFGPLLPSNAHINSGLGPNLRLGNFGYLPPTHLLTKERADVVIAGTFCYTFYMPIPEMLEIQMI